MVLGAGPEGNPVLKRPGEVCTVHIELIGREGAKERGHTVTAVRIDGLEETKRDPDVHRENVEVAAEGAVEERAGDRTGTEDKDLCRVSVLRSETEGRRVLVVDLVDVLVEGAPVKCLVGCS